MKKSVEFDPFDVGARRIAAIESRLDSLESKSSEGWTNSFQATEIGKLTSRISDLMGRISELEKRAIEPQMLIEQHKEHAPNCPRALAWDVPEARCTCNYDEASNTKSTKPSIVIDHSRLNCIIEMDSIVVDTLVNIQQASKNLLDHLQQTGGISSTLLKKLWDSLGYDNNPPRIVSIHP